MSASLRPAKEEDADRLSEIARTAKAHWGYAPEWLELWRPSLTFDAETIARDWMRVAEIDGEAVGVVALSGESGRVEIEHLWIDPPAMGLGIGRHLVDAALAEARSRGASRVEVVADPNAESFYRHLGAERIGSVDSQPAGRSLPLMVIEL